MVNEALEAHQRQAAAGKGEQSVPIFKAFGLGDSKKGMPDVLSSDAWISPEKSTQGIGGFLAARKGDGWLKALSQVPSATNSQSFASMVSSTSDISAPTSWVSRTSAGSKGGIEIS